MKIGVAALFALLTITGCTNDNFTKYKNLVAQEPASGKHADSLFMGIYFGMTSKDFFVHCWQLNKAGLFTDGENNRAVLYQLHNGELKYNASMNFYPGFLNGKIYKMEATFNYDAWAPWNKTMVADSLQQDVLKLFKKWYPSGNPFLRIADKERGIIYVKVDGNRRIIVGRYNDMRVKVDYTDLLTEQAFSK